ncbi:hypothetical protein LBMAG49_19020 [Planctomycetota bacterium]|nr:hypothetical protein LBMAG49_19020 [Planctomycetota bacterium]
MQPRAVLLLLALAGTMHAPALLGFFVYDDQLLIAQNAPLQRGDLWALITEPLFGLQQSYWRPLTALFLWLGNAFGGALGIHLIALLAHLVCTWQVFRIGSTLLLDQRAALGAALLFSLHPVQVEGVAWCAALGDALWLAFGCSCLLAALRSRTKSAALFFGLALLAKENAIVVLPLALAVRWQAGLPLRTLLGAMLAVAGGFYMLRMAVFGELTAGLCRAQIDPTVASQWPFAPLEMFGRELQLLLWPWPMSPFRVLGYGGGSTMVHHAFPALWALAWLVAFAASIPCKRRFLMCALLMIGVQPLLAALHCDRLGAYPIADRYLGSSVLGLALLLAHLVPARARSATFALLTLICGTATWLQTPVWRNQQQLIEHGIKAAPREPMLRVMAGNFALEQQDFVRARTRYDEALALADLAVPGCEHRAIISAQVGIGWCELRGEPPQLAAAILTFERVLNTDPMDATAWIGLGVAHGMSTHPADAERALRRATELAPQNSQAHYNLAYLLTQQGRRELARQSAEAALLCSPGNESARQLLQQLK